MPLGDYDKTLESSESLSLYEGSRFMRFIKDTIAGFRYGTKNNPKIKGNVVSYIDPMGRLITQEQTCTNGANNTSIEKTIRKISTSAKTEAFNSIEVIEKKKNKDGKVIEQARNFYPSIEDYEERASEPKIREITYYEDNETVLRKTIERLLDESEMKKRFDIGAIKLNPLAPESLKREIVKSRIIYTVDKQRKEEKLSDKLKPFGTHLQINETEKTYILSNELNPETDELHEYVGPKETEKDIILYAAGEPKARIEETDNITFSIGKIHNISTAIANYPDKDGNYGGSGRGTYAMYDDKILHATGNKCLSLTKDKDGKLNASVDSPSTSDLLAKVELRGNLINLNFTNKSKEEAEKVVPEIAETFKANWGINKATSIECKVKGSEKPFTIKYKDIAPKNEKIDAEKSNVSTSKKSNKQER